MDIDNSLFVVEKQEFYEVGKGPVRYDCIGRFIDPSRDDILRCSQKPYKIFVPDDGSYRIIFYSYKEIVNAVKMEIQN